MTRSLRLTAVAALAAVSVSASGLRPPERHTRRVFRQLCVLRAKPGNAFTFVRPEPRAARPTGAVPLAGSATANVTYTGFGAFPGAQAAFQYALDLWLAQLDSPIVITIDATFEVQAPGQLGSAGAQFTYSDFPGGTPSTFYGDPLADRIAGSDQGPGDFDIVAAFNSNVNWYFGTDGNTPGGQYDFVSTVLHELGHGLGFSGSAYAFNPGFGNIGMIGEGGIPYVFDLFTVTDTGALLLSFENESPELAVPLLSAYNAGDPDGPGVYWGGTAGKAANGGVTPRLYTTSTWVPGSSYSHLDETVFPEGNANSLMTFELAAAEAIHSPGPITLGMFEDMGWSGRPELMTNGSFSSGLANWELYATDGLSATNNLNYISATVVNGVLQYYRLPPAAGSNSAVVLNHSGAAFAAGAQILATFQVGNSSSVRKRISVLAHDSDFQDLSVCTFWVPPGAPLLTYKMLTHTTKAWANGTLSFYAASQGSNGGAYLLDNVSLREAPTAVAAETRCIDPWYPSYDGTLPSAEKIVDGGFDLTPLSPPWQTFGTLTPQISNGVFQFTRDSSAGPAGVLLQPTSEALPANNIVTASFDLGNSSNVRKRVTVLLHDLDFSDLTACTFWIPPGQPLRTYLMRTYVTESWGNATISIYAASVGTEQWTRLDNVSMRWTNTIPTYGTECGEPGSGIVAGRAPSFMNSFDIINPSAVSSLSSKNATTSTSAAPATSPAPVDGRRTPARVPVAIPTDGATPSMPAPPPLGGYLTFQSWLTVPALAMVQISADGQAWRTVALVPAADGWITVGLDLELFGEDARFVRLVFDPGRSGPDEPPGEWRIAALRRVPGGR